MPRLLTITTLAALACAVAATAAAGSATSKKKSSSKELTKSLNELGSPLKNKSTKPKADLPPLADFTKGKRPKGQDLAKELKERLKRTGSLSGKHHPEVESALKTAKSKKKQLLLLFTTATCPVCHKMQSEALGNKEFSNRFLKDYLVLNIDCDKKPEVAQHYFFEPKVPHYKVLDGKGQIVKEKTGYDSDTQFADWLAK